MVGPNPNPKPSPSPLHDLTTIDPRRSHARPSNERRIMKRRYGVIVALLATGLVAACGPSGSVTPGRSPSASATPPSITLNPGNVAVLVVDDFGFGRPDAHTRWPRTDNCGVATNEVGSGGAGDEPPPPPYSHGELVYRTLKQQLAAPANHLRPGASTTSPTNGRPVEVATTFTYDRNGSTSTVRLQAVHTAGYRTADIISGLAQATRTLARGAEPGGVVFTRFVVNLSFVVIPCDVGGWLAGGDADLLTSYQSLVTDPALRQFLAGKGYYDPATNTFNAAQIAPDGGPITQAVLTNPDLQGLRPATVSAFYRAAGTNVGENPLRQVSQDPAWQQYLGDPAGQGGQPTVAVVPVGAAGNGVWYRPDPATPPQRQVLHFPFAPALWPSVVSVSAVDESGLTDYSNWGEVAQDGSGPDIAPGARGTSFAAPRVAGQEAIYLLRGGPLRCDHTTPPLKYIPDATLGGWANLTWPDWDTRCGNFRAYATDS
jgi:hypothetical protein